MKFNDTMFSAEHRYSMGIEQESGKYYLSIPVSNRLVDYEEYYAITNSEFNDFSSDPDRAVLFAEACRRHEKDNRLILQPGRDRGEPV